MAYYKAIAAGNADTLAIWQIYDGGWIAASVLPGASDDVYTNNFIVTVTTSQSYLSWNRSSVGAPYSITQGGQFQIDGANEITTQGIIYGSNTTYASIVGLAACVNRLSTHIETWNHIGDTYGGVGNYVARAIGCWNDSTYSISYIGNIIGGSYLFSYGFYNNASATFTSIIGDQIGYGAGAYAFYNNASSTFTSIIGNQIGGNISGYGFYNKGVVATFTSIIGNQIGDAGQGFFNDATATFTSIIGNQIGGGSSGFYNNAPNTSIPFKGNVYASGIAGIYNAGLSSIIIYEGNTYNYLGVMAIYSPRLYINVTPTTVWEFSDFGGNSQFLYGAGVNTGHPIEADVRKDTDFGPNDEFTGTLAVPPPATVNLGVPTDNTTGTYESTPQDFLDALEASEFGQRLKNCATIKAMGDLITGLK